MVTQLLIHMIVHSRDGNISLVSMEIVVEKSKAHPFPEAEVHIERTTSAKEFMSVTAVFEHRRVRKLRSVVRQDDGKQFPEDFFP